MPDEIDTCIDVIGIPTNDPLTNGCPPDSDGDGIDDVNDACPNVAGIKTLDWQTNGCPDPDRDKDGILNDDDACPDEPGLRIQTYGETAVPSRSCVAAAIALIFASR